MEALFERLRYLSAPLRGIVHAAAVIKFCPLREMSADSLHIAMRAKVEGAWLLHELSSNIPLDFFVLFSSISATWGSGLQPGYAGIRPKIVPQGAPAQDFTIQGPAQHGVPGLIHLFGIESPGLTASLALAEKVRALAGNA